MNTSVVKKICVLAVFSAVQFTSGCATFISDENVDSLARREDTEYVLQMDIVRTSIGVPPGEKPEYIGSGRPNPYIDNKEEMEVLLPKGTRVKIYFEVTDEYIKVYGYPAKEDFLGSQHTLLLYILADDFVQSGSVVNDDAGSESQNGVSSSVIDGVYNQEVFDVYFNRVLQPAE